ncbi:hypothetical protein FisN_21Hh268 [Fistulifera solaris]|uniref:Secreted protein n=1 Tax=Fistulifera solaris TaxID=1519565 RepID=A0A1Z5KPP6_FISSO|nr:hypothetical protein FisN_21Hh268 [Fistulifera solaris]|eukprot:GAX27918.1 hypothetical protein FisN_21Hh268 [Fistulifera solaris]
MKTSLGLLTTLIVSHAAFSAADETIGLCCLCDSCGPALSGRANLAVDNKGYTCQKLIIDMADPTNSIKQGNAACRQLQGRWYDHCCNPSHKPTAIAQSPVPSPATNYPRGSYSKCDLCRDGSYPSLDKTLVAVLNFPNVNTCKELYWWARNGNFEDRMCRPIQNYFNDPCGCGKGSSSGNSGGNTGGGAPDNNFGGSNPSTGGTPPKKTMPKVVKDTNKMYTENNRRGGLGRKRRVKGTQ